MSSYGRSIVVVLVIGWVTLSAPAAIGGPQGKKQDPLELLMKLEGTWEVDVGGGGKATCAGKKIAGGKGVYTFFKRTTEKETYEAHTIWTIDPQTRKIYVFELNSYGDIGEHVGKFRPDGSLYLIRKARTGKRVVVQKTHMTWKSGDEIVSRIDEKQKGKWESFTFTFKRAKGG